MCEQTSLFPEQLALQVPTLQGAACSLSSFSLPSTGHRDPKPGFSLTMPGLHPKLAQEHPLTAERSLSTPGSGIYNVA